MTSSAEHDPDTDRFGYSRSALARLVLSFEMKNLAELAAGVVATSEDGYAEPGDLVADAVHLVEVAKTALAAAVVCERQKGTSWQAVGEELGGITRQSAHERYQQAVEEWELGLVEPHEPSDGGYRSLRLHEAAYEPTLTGRQLDEWAREHVRACSDDDHPVTGYLRPLSTTEEMVQVLAAIQHAQTTQAGPEYRAKVHDRKAALLDRIAAEDGRPDVAVQADESRALAARLREEARNPRGGPHF